ncbi:MAG TPA: class I SAM-dependent methyltransferase [Holophaga sp.]|nr:class I SAM-dependent methyltransferase [Holophaga sp.]
MIALPAPLEALLRRLLADGRAHDAATQVHAERFLNLEWETAETLFLLLRAAGRRRVLEIGTSNGFSTLWLAQALEATGGTVVSIDRDAGRQAQAAAHLAEAGLAHRATLLHGPATDVVRGLEGTFDAVFFDADRVSAPDQGALLLPRLAPDALLLADNALSHPQEIQGYLDWVDATGLFDARILPVGKGLHVAVRRSFLEN